MSATIKQIADICGLSREEVFRILSDQPLPHLSVNQMLAVKRVAQNMGYVSSPADASLSGKGIKRVGVILNSIGNPFFDDILRGLYKAYDDLKDYGLSMSLRTMQGYDPETQLRLMDELSPHIDVLILTPIDHPSILKKIDAMFAQGLHCFTLNTDIEDSRRICYVGSDYHHGGRIAGNLAGLLFPQPIELGIIAGARNILGHRQRVKGFSEIVQAQFPHIHMTAKAYDDDDEAQAQECASQMMQAHPDIQAFFVAAAGISGVCKAILRAGREQSASVIGFDSVPATLEHMRSGIIKAILFQRPVLQGYKVLKLAFYCLMSGEMPEQSQYIVNTDIKILANVMDDEANDVV